MYESTLKISEPALKTSNPKGIFKETDKKLLEWLKKSEEKYKNF